MQTLLAGGANDFPNAPEMFFGGEKIAEADAHHGAATQLGLHQVGFAVGIAALLVTPP